MNRLITTALIETDCFMDYSEFADFACMERFNLYVFNEVAEYFGDGHIARLW